VTNKMKMTDAALLDLAYTIASTKHPWAMQYVEAIRSLRDAAKTLCDSAKEEWGTGYSIQPEWGIGYSLCYTIDKEKLDDLRKLLPKEPQ
jgi:hypothetical protein